MIFDQKMILFSYIPIGLQKAGTNLQTTVGRPLSWFGKCQIDNSFTPIINFPFLWYSKSFNQPQKRYNEVSLSPKAEVQQQANTFNFSKSCSSPNIQLMAVRPVFLQKSGETSIHIPEEFDNNDANDDKRPWWTTIKMIRKWWRIRLLPYSFV